jgi:hypothetical protein
LLLFLITKSKTTKQASAKLTTMLAVMERLRRALLRVTVTTAVGPLLGANEVEFPIDGGDDSFTPWMELGLAVVNRGVGVTVGEVDGRADSDGDKLGAAVGDSVHNHMHDVLAMTFDGILHGWHIVLLLICLPQGS